MTRQGMIWSELTVTEDILGLVFVHAIFTSPVYFVSYSSRINSVNKSHHVIYIKKFLILKAFIATKRTRKDENGFSDGLWKILKNNIMHL